MIPSPHPALRIGTCSWKYPSWAGLVYSAPEGINFLEEYSRRYDSVEVDQWFWSLFSEASIGLPDESVVLEYARSVPDDFLFTVKAPNAVTLTHFYKKKKDEPLRPNARFFSPELFRGFLDRLSPLGDRLGPVMLQFEYLNKQKCPSLSEFLRRLEGFLEALSGPGGSALPVLGVELRNPNWLCREYFEFLRERRLAMVFLQGYYMPSILEVFEKFGDLVEGTAVIRLHGTERGAIEETTKGVWNRIVEPKDAELPAVAIMAKTLLSRGVKLFLNVNNHYEGSAPLTIEKMRSLLA